MGAHKLSGLGEVGTSLARLGVGYCPGRGRRMPARPSLRGLLIGPPRNLQFASVTWFLDVRLHLNASPLFIVSKHLSLITKSTRTMRWSMPLSQLLDATAQQASPLTNLHIRSILSIGDANCGSRMLKPHLLANRRPVRRAAYPLSCPRTQQ